MQGYIEKQTGIKIGEEKSYLIESRLSKLIKELKMSNFENLYYKILADKTKHYENKVIDAITTNETLWFRDKLPWEVFENVLLPNYIEALRKEKVSKIRIWSAACSSGQEPYSIAMLIDNYLIKNKVQDIKLSDFEIIATDISISILDIAKKGEYDFISISRGLDESYRRKYFKKKEKVWVLDSKIINSVKFIQFNLLNSFMLLGKFDLIFFRYVMIYFSNTLKKQMIKKIHNALLFDGVLFIGSSELMVDYKDLFTDNRYKNSTFYKKSIS